MFVVLAASPINELVEITPFTLLVSIPVDVAKVVVLFEITELVAIDPAILLVKIFPIKERVLEALRFKTLRLLVLRLVPVAFVKRRLVNNPFIEDKKFEKKLVEVALLLNKFVLEELTLKKLVLVELLKLRLSILVVEITPLTLEVISEPAEDKRLAVPLASIALRLVVAITPLTLEVSSLPIRLSALEFTILALTTIPLTELETVLDADERAFVIDVMLEI